MKNYISLLNDPRYEQNLMVRMNNPHHRLAITEFAQLLSRHHLWVPPPSRTSKAKFWKLEKWIRFQEEKMEQWKNYSKYSDGIDHKYISREDITELIKRRKAAAIEYLDRSQRSPHRTSSSPFEQVIRDMDNSDRMEKLEEILGGDFIHSPNIDPFIQFLDPIYSQLYLNNSLIFSLED